jgi:uncharacterized protein (DUF2062 family)
MLRKYLKRYTPPQAKIKEHRFISCFGRLLHDPRLWHLSRHSVPGAFAIGLFWAFFPIPGQMLIAGIFAIYFKKNIPISVALIWITNPVTIPPIFYANYRIGAFLLGLESVSIRFSPSLEWLMATMHAIWWPLLLGSLVVATVSSIVGYYLISGLWRLSVVISHRKRKERNRERNAHRVSQERQKRSYSGSNHSETLD